jgi:co-chaperonin GroES (HSP10)
MSNKTGKAEKWHVNTTQEATKNVKELKKELYEQRDIKLRDKTPLILDDFFLREGIENFIRIEADIEKYEVLPCRSFSGFPIQVGNKYESPLLGTYIVKGIENKENGIVLTVKILQPKNDIDFSKITFEALSDRILVYPDKTKEVEMQKSGIVTINKKENLPRGTVISAGQGKPIFDAFGTFLHFSGTSLKKGDRVLFPKEFVNGTIEIEGYEFIIMREDDVYLRIDIPENEPKNRLPKNVDIA